MDKQGNSSKMFQGKKTKAAPQEIIGKQADIIKRAKANEKLRKLNIALIEAIQARQLVQVKILIEKGANLHLQEGEQVHFYNNDENNPLHLAAEKGLLSIVKYLVSNGANVNARNRREVTPLHFAVHEGHASIIKFLIEKGADIEAIDIDGGTPLSWAAYVGKQVPLKLLTQYGADIHIADNNNTTPLHWACYKDNFEMVKFLIKHGADADIETLNNNEETPLTLAILNGCTQIVLYLINLMAKLEEKEQTYSNEEAVHACSEEPASLHLAVQKGQLSAVKFLLEKGFNINGQNTQKVTPLHLAVLGGHTAIIKLLVENGADIEAIDIEGSTPLCWAARIGNLSALKLLVKYGANVHAVDNKKIVPLHWACYKDKFEMVKFLIEHGADADIQKLNTNQDTPLTAAILNGCTQIVLYLIKVITTR
ncbi:MAG: ankyrin repeat domain-containing protein [Gammaproteobacteria bacterium]